MQKRAVILLSGGLDSATTLAIAKSEGFACYALSFRYGQRHGVELEAARRVASHLGATDHVILDIELPQVDVEDDVVGGAEVARDAPRGLELYAMSLPVPERERVAREPLALGDGEGRGGVEATRKEDDGAFLHPPET